MTALFRRSGRRRGAYVLTALCVTLLLAFVASLMAGTTPLGLSRVARVFVGQSHADPEAAIVVQNIRLPRSLTALLAGAALGVAGLQMQTLFRNPLADPFTLGVSSGASLGVALVVLGAGGSVAAAFGSAAGLRNDALVVAAAAAGAATVLTFVLAVSRRIANHATVLVMGLMAGYAAAAAVTVLIGMSQPEHLQQWAQWGFGSFSGVTWPRLRIFAAVIATGVLGAAVMTRPLNALLLGDEYARSMGVPVTHARWFTMLDASLLGAVVTAFCGPIAFMGLAVPHLCRGLLGTADHRVLLPAVALMGAAIALVAQTLSLAPGRSGVLPLNAITSLIGAPVVAAVLWRGRTGGGEP